jgi:LacI family transcriptional regulator
MRQKSPTVVDVARHAGLSVTTVSRVMNNSGYYSPKTLEKVEQAVRLLDYRPNLNARSLKGKSTFLVGLIIPDLSNTFYTNLANTVLACLRARGYNMILFTNEEDPVKDLCYLKILEEQHVDGILYTHPTDGSNTVCLHEMTERGIPIVEVNRQREGGFLDAVLADNLRGVKQAMEYLLQLSHRKIALVSGSSNTITGEERLLGYRTAIEEIGIEVNPDYIKMGSFTREHGEIAAEELLSLKERPTAIFAGNNRIILGVLRTLQRNNVRVPADISLVAFDDTEWLSVWNPPISVVDIAVNEMAQLAVDLLIRRMTANETLKPLTYYLSTNLITRQSCRRLGNVCYN